MLSLKPVFANDSAPLSPEAVPLVGALDLNKTLKHVCESEAVQTELKKVITTDKGTSYRFHELQKNRLDLRHEIAKDALDRVLKITENIIPLLSIGSSFRDSNSLLPSEDVLEQLSLECGYMAGTDGEYLETYQDRLQELANLQARLGPFKGKVVDFKLHQESESLFSMMVKASYERVLIEKIPSLFANPELQFGLNLPKKLKFPPIYPVDPLFEPGTVAYPIRRAKEIEKIFPPLDRPSKYLVGRPAKFIPVGTLAEDLFDHFLIADNQHFSFKRFLTQENGNQDEAPQSGFRIGQSMQWLRGKVDFIRKGRPRFRQLTQDLKPYLKKWVEFTLEVSDNEFYEFLDKFALKLPGEGAHALDGDKVASPFGNDLSINQRRLVAAWQLFLRFDLANLVEDSARRADSVSEEQKKSGYLAMYNVAMDWLKELSQATKAICSASSALDLEFLEEHPTAVAHHLMTRAAQVNDPEFIRQVDGYCNSGSVRPPNKLDVDHWLAKPWGITRRIQTENVLMSSSVVFLLSGGMIAHLLPAPGGRAVGFAMIHASQVVGTIGALSKTHHFLTKLSFDSALTNPNNSIRRTEQAGILFHALTIPLYAFGFLEMGSHVAKNGLGMFLMPPGKGLTDVLFKGAPNLAGQSLKSQGPKALLNWFSQTSKVMVQNWKSTAASSEGAKKLMSEGMKLVAFSRVFTAVGITSQKFKEIGVNPYSSPAFWTDTFQTYVESVLTGNLIANANSIGGFMQLFLFTQAETYILESFMKHSMSLFKGKLPDARYMEWALKWRITKELTYKPSRVMIMHGLKYLAGKSPLTYILTASLWDYLFFGYPYSNMINSVVADFNTNKEIGFFEAWQRLEFRDFHLNEAGALVCGDCQVNHYDKRNIQENGILNFDEHIFESLIYLGRDTNTHDPLLDALLQMRLSLLAASISATD